MTPASTLIPIAEIFPSESRYAFAVRTFFVPLGHTPDHILKYIAAMLQREYFSWDGTFQIESSFSFDPIPHPCICNNTLFRLPDNHDTIRVCLTSPSVLDFVFIAQVPAETKVSGFLYTGQPATMNWSSDYVTPWPFCTKITTTFHERIASQGQ